MRPGFGVVGRPARGGFSTTEKAKLIFLCLLALAVFAAFLQLVVRARGRRGESRTEAPVRIPSVVARPPVDLELLRKGTRDGSAVERTELEAAPREHLLLVARNLSPAHFESAPPPDLAALDREPARFRGEFYRMRGRLLAMDGIDLGPGATPHVRGSLELEEGGIVFFAALTAGDAEAGDFVRLDGVFWKRYGGPAGEEGYREGPLFVGRNLVRSFERMAPVLALDPALLDRVRDGTAAEKAVIEREPHNHLLAYARDGARAEEFAAAPEFEDALRQDLLKDPAAFRGKPFRLFGEVHVLVTGVPDEHPLRLDHLTQAWIFNYQTDVQRVDFPGPVENVSEGDLAWIDAYFLKQHAYESVSGETMQVPLFVARRFERYVEPVSSFGSYLTTGAIASAGITLAIFLVALFSKEKREGRRAVAKAIAARRSRAPR